MGPMVVSQWLKKTKRNFSLDADLLKMRTRPFPQKTDAEFPIHTPQGVKRRAIIWLEIRCGPHGARS
jgi:hypothetical protein